MGLRDQAAADNKAILEDKDFGFGWDIALTDPAETSEDFVGFSNEISQIIDPDTGQVISSKSASVAIHIASILEKFSGLPVGISDSSSKAWLVTFKNIGGISHTYKVEKSNPDEAIGMIVLILEAYET
jgi:hypothetical protein